MTRVRAAEMSLALDAIEDPFARRDFIKLLGAALGLAGVTGCTRAPREEIVPYVVQPPEVTPGVPRFYATATVLDGYASGVLVESHEGRPTKIEGNPEHPASRGAATAFSQASLLGLYDPARARGVVDRGRPSSWLAVRERLLGGAWTKARGRGLHVVIEPTSSPTAVDLIRAIQARYPEAAFHVHAAAPRTAAWEGAKIAFGRVLEGRPLLARTDVVVAIDADFFQHGAASLGDARDFAARRRATEDGANMNRLYVVEAAATITGMMADHRLAVAPRVVAAVAAALLAEVLRLLPTPGLEVPAALATAAAPHAPFVRALARDLVAHGGRGAILVGDAQPAVVHAIGHALDAVLGNLGPAFAWRPSPIVLAGEPHFGLGGLVAAQQAGAIETVLVLGANVAYAAPTDQDVRAIVMGAAESVYLGAYADETAACCRTHVAEAHPLESWSDARAFDGSEAIVQPLIEPLFDGCSSLTVLAALAGVPETSAYDLVRARFQRVVGRDEVSWRTALKRGVVANTAFDPVTPTFSPARVTAALREARTETSADADHALEAFFALDPHVHDGRFAEHAWLLEMPAPLTSLTWTNAATLAPETAAALGIQNGDEVELRAADARVRAAALLTPGQAEGTLGLTLGWGRTHTKLAANLGANAFALRTSGELFHRAVTIRRTGARRELPLTQVHKSLEGRDEEILRHTTLAETRTREALTRDALADEPGARGAAKQGARRPLPLYDTKPGSAANGVSAHQWGMVIDLALCTGCSACVVACQAENNVPTVGADEVLLGRAMHWLRVDSYALVGAGPKDAPRPPDAARPPDASSARVASQPMLCQHCEKAPCEYVCPTNATVHSADGLNQMVYNRCVGTRFCSNNCPYKVRRFNWFDFHHGESETEQLAHNPDVTVRERGVMEKCTFCVQRVREFDIKSEVRRARGAEPPPAPQTACQQTCPTSAIVFGDLNDPSAEVTRLQRHPRAYSVLGELGTEPRVRYLTRVSNPNPELT